MNSRTIRRLGLAVLSALVISACSGEDESESLERAVVIARENVASIAVKSTSDKTTFAPGETWTFTALATREDGTTFDATSRVDWRSSDPGVGKIDGGKFTAGAVTGVLPVSISAEWAQFSANLDVNVSDAALVSISTTLADQGPINECLSASAAAVGNYSDGSVRPLSGLTWTSSAPDIAKVDENGSILTLNAGSSDITASLAGVVSEPAPLAVSDTLSGITVSGANGATGTTSVPVGSTASLVATGIFSNGTPAQPITPAVAWRSADEATVTVDAAGSLRGVAPGTAEIIASCGGLEGTVSANAVGINGVVIVNPRSDNLVAGDRVKLELYGVLSNGEQSTEDLAGRDDNSVIWRIPADEGGTLATIDKEGVLEINTMTNIVSLTTVTVEAQFIQGTQTYNATLLVYAGPTR